MVKAGNYVVPTMKCVKRWNGYLGLIIIKRYAVGMITETNCIDNITKKRDKNLVMVKWMRGCDYDTSCPWHIGWFKTFEDEDEALAYLI